MRALTFIGGWLTGFMALAVMVSALFGVMHLCAIAAYWGEGWMPKAPWFLWRFFVALSFFLSMPAGFAALHGDQEG